jgi:hypothetical protein
MVLLAADHLKIVFTQISEAVPEEPYMFALQVGEGDKYTGGAAASSCAWAAALLPTAITGMLT